MMGMQRQRGVALFTVVFLIVVVGLLAVTVGIISGQQQLTSAQTLEQTRALYAARARLEREIAECLDNGSTSGDGVTDFAGFDTELVGSGDCGTTNVDEGGSSYDIYQLEVRASRGNQQAGTLVQRTVKAQVRGPDK